MYVRAKLNGDLLLFLGLKVLVGLVCGKVLYKNFPTNTSFQLSVSVTIDNGCQEILKSDGYLHDLVIHTIHTIQ